MDAMVTCYAAVPGGGEAVWRQLQSDRSALGLEPVACRKPAGEPWLAAMLRIVIPTSVNQMRAMMNIAVWEQGAAWALLRWGTPLSIDAPPAEPPERASQERSKAMRDVKRVINTLVGRSIAAGANGLMGLVDQQAPRLKGTLATAIAGLDAEKRAPEEAKRMAATLRSCARLSIEGQIVERAGELKLPPDEVTQHWDRLIKLPHNPCWIEYSHRDLDAAADFAEFLPDRFGLLLRMEAGLLRFEAAMHSHGQTIVLPGTVVVKPNGYAVEGDASGHLSGIAVGCAAMAVRLLLLLAARNAPLKIGPQDPMERLNRSRAKQGKPPVLSTAPVRWNLTRYERRAERVGESFHQQRREQTVAALIRGHHKVRMVAPRDENGRRLPDPLEPALVWWSPFVRNVQLGFDGNGRDYDVRAGRAAA